MQQNDADAVEAFLAHHGVKGMRWGIRNDSSSSPAPKGGALVKPKRRTAPLLADFGDVKGVGAKAKVYGGQLAGDAANKVATLAAVASAAQLSSAGVVATNTAYGVAMGSMAASNAIAIPAIMAGKAYFTPLSTAYHTSKSDIRRGTKALNVEYSKPGHDLRTDKSLQSSYNKSYEKVVRDALNKSKSPWTHPFRALAEHRVGKTSENEYRFDFKLNEPKKPTAILHGPTRFVNEIKLGKLTHDDSDDDVLTTYAAEVTFDADGFVEDFSIPDLEDLVFEDVVEHTDILVDDFLAHFGIKGMHWGVRRSDAALASLNKKQEKLTKQQAKINKKAEKLGIKKGDDEDSVDVAGKTKLSADAERFLKTRQKAGHEMSDREIKEAIQRAENIKKYNDLFNPDENKILQDKVNQLNLQKQYGQLKAELHPSAIARVNRFIKGTGNASYESFKTVDKLADGKLSASLRKTWDAMRGKSTTQKIVGVPLKVATAGSTTKNPFGMVPNPNFTKKKKGPDPVFKVTSL